MAAMRKSPRKSTRAERPSIENLVQLHASLAKYNEHLVGENHRLTEAVKAAEEKPREDLLSIVSEATEVLRRTTKVMTETCALLAAKDRPLDEIMQETRDRLHKVCLAAESQGFVPPVTRS